MEVCFRERITELTDVIICDSFGVKMVLGVQAALENKPKEMDNAWIGRGLPNPRPVGERGGGCEGLG